ncbi:MAG: division/cell wall cluster transcriptional repressor MraZ [Clostridiales bacterium]|nr:division/cell wall cluster transcriptional repressor MraZ [Clostridiales bacterium]
MPFLGEYRHKLDEKNRIAIPAKFREGLGESFVVCRAPKEHCLFLYSFSEWENVAENIKQHSKTEKERNMQRRALAGASTVDMDKSGRITLSKELCGFASLDGDIVSYGANNRIEIWNAEKWDAMLEEDFFCDEDEELEIQY